MYPTVLTFGFEPTEYSVNEDDGSVDIGIFFISGNAGEFVPHVITNVSDGTATGGYYVHNFDDHLTTLLNHYYR